MTKKVAKKMKPKALILTGDGINCEQELKRLLTAKLELTQRSSILMN